MRFLILIATSLLLWSCGYALLPMEQAVYRSDKIDEKRVLDDKELGNAFTDWHEYYFVMQCTGWDGDSNQPTTSDSSSKSTGYSVGPGSQSAPGRIPSSQLPESGSSVGIGAAIGGGGNLMNTVRGYNEEKIPGMYGGACSHKDGKEKAVMAFVKSQ